MKAIGPFNWERRAASTSLNLEAAMDRTQEIKIREARVDDADFIWNRSQCGVAEWVGSRDRAGC